MRATTTAAIGEHTRSKLFVIFFRPPPHKSDTPQTIQCPGSGSVKQTWICGHEYEYVYVYAIQYNILYNLGSE